MKDGLDMEHNYKLKTSSMRRLIKITGLNDFALRQTPGRRGIWKDCEFVFNNPDFVECDYWFVFDPNGASSDGRAICSPDNVFFVMGEPDDIHVYYQGFIHQFHNIVTAQRHQHKAANVIRGFWGLWFVGLEFYEGNRVVLNPLYDYDAMKIKELPKKEKLLSVITSNKTMCDGHIKRIKFVELLKKHFGNDIDVFGRGINDFADKADVLMPYKYHIAIENTSQNDYVTEKLLDPYLTYTYPIYYGAPNVNEYFSEESLSSIDINRPEDAVKRIETVIHEERFENSIDQIKAMREKVLNEYNIFNEMYMAIQNHRTVREKRLIVLKPEYEFSYKYRFNTIIRKIRQGILRK